MTSSQVAQLTYHVGSGLLTGVIGGKQFAIQAESGGGRGSTKSGIAQNSLASRLTTTQTIKRGGKHIQRGGPLPMGTYACTYLKHHHNFGECIQLHRDAQHLHHIHSPFASQPIPHNRKDDFFIHGRGKLGSDGCIVPSVPQQRLDLNKAIRDFPGQVVLTVRGGSYVLPAERFDGRLA